MSNDPNIMGIVAHYVEVGHYVQALQKLDGMCSPDLNDPEYWYLRGMSLYGLNCHAEAQQMSEKGLSIAPYSTELLFLDCRCKEKLDNLADAERSILSALSIDRANPWFISYYAKLVALAGQFEKADRLIAEAALLDPENAALAEVRVMLAYLRDDKKHMEINSRRLLSMDPENRYGHYMRGVYHEQKGDVSGAARSFGNAARHNPDDRDAGHAARQARNEAHWLLRPYRLFQTVWGLFLFFFLMFIAPMVVSLFSAKAASVVGAIFFLYLVCGSFLHLVLVNSRNRR